MKYIKLSNGFEMPVIGLGMWDSHEREAEHAVAAALKNGYKNIDTAMFYKNETEVGTGIKISGIPREDVIVSTKIWYDDMYPEKVRETFEKSLSNLQLDYVDVYFLHWPINDYVGSWKVLEELYEEGKIKVIGVCNFQKHHLETLMKEAKIKPMINQIESHPTFSQAKLIDYCKEQGIAVQAWGPIGKGQDIQNEIILALAEKYGKTPAQIILRWHVQRDIIAIPKTIKEHRLVENMDVFDFELSKEDMDLISSLDTGKTNRGYQPGYQWE